MDLNPKLYVLEEFGHGSKHVLQQRKTKSIPLRLEWGKREINSLLVRSKAQL